jgi:hypothetical protein
MATRLARPACHACLGHGSGGGTHSLSRSCAAQPRSDRPSPRPRQARSTPAMRPLPSRRKTRRVLYRKPCWRGWPTTQRS